MTPLARACHWVDAHLPAFAIRAPLAPSLPALKAVAELAHTADFLMRTRDPEAISTGRRWLGFAWREMAEGELVRSVIASDPRFVPVAVTYLPFHLSGLHNDALRTTIAAQIRSAIPLDPIAWAMTVPALRLLGFEPDRAMEAQARSASALASKTPAADLTNDAAYGLVHECLYASGWGREVPHFDPPTAAYISATLPALIAQQRADADLLAELILASHAVSLSCVEPGAWSSLEQAQTRAGNVIPPDRPVTMVKRHAHPALSRTYHTTLAAIMSWSACHHRDR